MIRSDINNTSLTHGKNRKTDREKILRQRRIPTDSSSVLFISRYPAPLQLPPTAAMYCG